MYIVKVKDTDETLAICSRKEDAEAFARAGGLDKKQYKIEIA